MRWIQLAANVSAAPDDNWAFPGAKFILADKLGFAEGYVGEHSTDKAENITSCMVFIASIIHQTKQMKLGTGTINMPNQHPAAVAANIAMLDHMLDGRFIFGISPGALTSDAEALGILDKDRNKLFAEATRLAVREDVGIIPLYWQKHSWATKAGLRYEPPVQDDNAVRFVHVEP